MIRKEYSPMLFGYFYGDWSILIVLPALIFTLWAQSAVKSAYHQYSRVRNAHGMTGADAARRILNQNGLHHVRIERVAGQMTDHYDPREEVIRLSEGVYDSPSVAAVGIAAHEAGHAVQHLCIRSRSETQTPQAMFQPPTAS